MHDSVEALGREQREDRLRIADVESVESKPRVSLQACKARLLELGILIVVEVVDTDDVVIAFE
jgi:hypothetical protein